MKLEVHVEAEGAEQSRVVLGPCPGCQAWQVDYTSQVAREHTDIVVEAIYEFGSEVPVDFAPTFDDRPFRELLEGILQEHLDECPHLRKLLADSERFARNTP